MEYVQKTLRAVRRARAGAHADGQGTAREQRTRAVRPCDRRIRWVPSVRGRSTVELKPILRSGRMGLGNSHFGKKK